MRFAAEYHNRLCVIFFTSKTRIAGQRPFPFLKTRESPCRFMNISAPNAGIPSKSSARSAPAPRRVRNAGTKKRNACSPQQRLAPNSRPQAVPAPKALRRAWARTRRAAADAAAACRRNLRVAAGGRARMQDGLNRSIAHHAPIPEKRLNCSTVNDVSIQIFFIKKKRL